MDERKDGSASVLVPIDDLTRMLASSIQGAFEAAGRLALAHRLLALRAKGREPTHVKALDQWRKNSLEHERNQLLNQVAVWTEPLKAQPLRRWQEMELLLLCQIEDKLNRKRGPRPKARAGGLLSFGVPKPRSEGRPRIQAAEEELRWLRFLHGMKLRMYARVKGATPGITVDEALRLLGREADRDRVSPSALLNAVISDSKVLSAYAAQHHPTATVDVLKKRLQRGRARHHYVLRPPRS